MFEPYWFLAVAAIALGLMTVGSVTARKLSPENRKIRIRRYAGLGLAIMFFSLPLFRPFVSSTPYSLNKEPRQEAGMTSAEHELQQNNLIGDLREEIISLRTDLKTTAEYYSLVIFFLSALLGSTFLSLFLGGSTPLLGEAIKEIPEPEKYDLFNKN
ncbi:MAG: hypothetical protein ABL984_21415 [Pyrinomonadaceae bacterium]